MTSSPPKQSRIPQASLAAAAEARRAKREDPDDFGVPELFIVGSDGGGFNWDLRRFGELVLQRRPKASSDAASTWTSDENALAALLASVDLPKFTRPTRSYVRHHRPPTPNHR